MIRQHAASKLIFIFAPIAVASITVVMKSMGPRYWWFGFLIAQTIYLYMSESVLKGQSVLNRLGKERVLLNLRAAGLSSLPKVFGFQWRFVLLACAIGFTFVATIQDDVQRGFNEIAHILRAEQLILRVEYPAWVEAAPTEKRLNSEGVELQADTASFLGIHTKNLKSTTWAITIAAQSSDSSAPKGAPLTIQVGKDGSERWGLSITSLYELLGADKTKKYSLAVVALDGAGDKILATVHVAPTTLPVVTLMPATDTDKSSSSDLAFFVSAQSRIPLTMVELDARTKSGYHFSKTAAEFAGSSELLLKNTRASLSTVGIPFSPKDVLYVKAIAKTIVNGIAGESAEIAIPIVSREELRRELQKQLESALKLFEPSKNAFDKVKQEIAQSLQQAESMALSLGRQSYARKKTSEALAFSNRMQTLSDTAALLAKQRIRAVLEALKRSQAMQETASLFSRMQGLRNNIQRASPKESSSLSPEARMLANMATSLQNKLNELAQDPSLGLSNEEKTAVHKLIRADATPQNLMRVANSLTNSQKEKALQEVSKTIGETQQSLGAVTQILLGARQRAIKQAREHLTNADNRLQQARTKPMEKVSQDLRAAEDALKHVPKLSKDLAEAVGDAQSETSRAQKSAEENNSTNMVSSLDKAQESIAQAFETLQDEEQQEKDKQQEMDGADQRSAQELITAQGILDAGWRKLILDEISRLRSQGEPPDSPILKFLESRLR